jgi:hypothetical protein
MAHKTMFREFNASKKDDFRQVAALSHTKLQKNRPKPDPRKRVFRHRVRSQPATFSNTGQTRVRMDAPKYAPQFPTRF